MKKILLSRVALCFTVLLLVSNSAWSDNIFYANNNLTFEQFMGAYTGEDKALHHDAITYLYGVIDATEKKEWCSFWEVKSFELIGGLYSLLREVDKSRYNERAAHVIIDVLKKYLSCGRKK